MNQLTAVDTLDKKDRRSADQAERRPASNPIGSESPNIIVPHDPTHGKTVEAFRQIAAAQRKRNKDPFAPVRMIIRERELSLEQLAAIWGCCRNTAGSRVRDPGSITLRELRLLSKYTGVSREELMAKAWR